MKDNLNIDELLNSFIDGELGPREQTEVQRLIAHDAQIAKRLQELQKCRELVGALPFSEAPAEMRKGIKAALERRTLLGLRQTDFDTRAGARHLMVRKLVAAAAMIGLFGVLAALVYTIVSPQDVEKKPVAVERLRQPAGKVVVRQMEMQKPQVRKPQATPVVVATAEKEIPKPRRAESVFDGKIELKVRDVAAVNAYISRAVEDNGLLLEAGPVVGQSRLYTIHGGQDDLGAFLSDLKSVWNRFDSARLFVGEVVVNNVSAEQIAKIAGQWSLKESINAAKDIAALNNMNERLPGKEVFAAVGNKGDDLTSIPKPVLTSREKTVKKPVSSVESERRARLTIVVIPNE